MAPTERLYLSVSNAKTDSYPTWINGQQCDQLPVNDRGLAYGDGVFETIRISQQGPVLFQGHMQRLQEGLQRLAIEHDWPLLLSQIESYPGLQPSASGFINGVVKIIVTRGSGGRGYGVLNVAGPNCIVSFHEAPQYPAEYARNGVDVFHCQTRLAQDAMLAGIKHLNRLSQVMARQEWHADFQEGLMQDTNGNVIEGVFSNVFIVKDEKLFTPKLDLCGVNGVMRQWLMQQFQSQGYPVVETSVTLSHFELADECFFCNSVFGIWPVKRFGNRHWPVGKHTRLAQQWAQAHWGL